MVTIDEVESKVIDIICNVLYITDKSQITKDTHIDRNLMDDDLDGVAIMLEFEKAFDITINDDEFYNLIASGSCTVQSLINLVNRLRK